MGVYCCDLGMEERLMGHRIRMRGGMAGGRLAAWTTALLALAGLAGAVCAEPQKTAHSMVDLVAEQGSLPTDGGVVTVGLFLQPDATWHAYWVNPGDAGKQPVVDWTLPQGSSASPLQFPPPRLLPFAGLNTYAFEEAVLLLADIQVPPGLAAGEEVVIGGDASWVVCDDEVCVPERAKLSVRLAVGDGAANPAQAEAFAAARAKLPRAVDWPARFEVAQSKLRVEIVPRDAEGAFDDAYLFIESRQLVRYAEQTFAYVPGGIAFSMAAYPRAGEVASMPAVLRYSAADGAERHVALTLSQGMAPATLASGAFSLFNPSSTGAALIAAFLGGIILNLMPCVFPILSMKAMSLLGTSHARQRASRVSGLLYAAGVLVAFAIVGAILLALRSAGEAVGWGFHLQSPVVTLCLGLLMFAVGLNLAGVFELGGRLTGVGQSLTEGGEQRAAFFTGLLAVAVATPCTAPFMAPALGFALTQTPVVAMAALLCLGLGLAFPYLLLSFVPVIGRAMPKPGAWTATLRQVLAFPMFATGVWLVWILGRQLGVNDMAVALLAILGLAFGLWAWGRSSAAARKPRWLVSAAAGLVACAAAVANVGSFRETSAGEERLGQIALERFSPELVTGYVEAGQPVFLYFTADWCVTCKVNERVALAADSVGAAFKERGVKVVVGDWTTEDATITEWLERYDHIGVPLYLYFPSGSALDTATVLPQVLLPDTVINAIDSADARFGGRGAKNRPAAAPPAEGAGTAEEQPYVLPDAEPDWGPVQAYIDADALWHDLDREIRGADAPAEEKRRRLREERGEHPDIEPAQAAATAIAKLDGTHEKTLEAAEFLVEHTAGAPGQTEAMILGATTLLERYPDYAKWGPLLMSLDFHNEPGASPEIEDILARLAEGRDDPLTAATARYYVASRSMRQANAISTPAEQRSTYRRKALAMLEGLSEGVEDQELVRRRRFLDDGTPISFQTMAEAEEDLLHTLNFVSVGTSIPDVSADRRDGTEERVSAYRGQTVLLDFWATWCGPCVASLPKLRSLVDELPAHRFEILSISVDEKLSTVTEFQADEPMPWANWHIGPSSSILKTWAVRGYPTYILIDAEGTILARQHDLSEPFVTLIKTTAGGADRSAASS